ncbi:MAG: hypothetical protein AAFN93_11170 [Bacteroidota bacterium]
MESPTERNKYKNLSSFNDKLEFLKNHFILHEMEIRLMERKYLLSTETQQDLMDNVDSIISKLES